MPTRNKIPAINEGELLSSFGFLAMPLLMSHTMMTVSSQISTMWLGQLFEPHINKPDDKASLAVPVAIDKSEHEADLFA